MPVPFDEMRRDRPVRDLYLSAKGTAFRAAHRILDRVENAIDEKSTEVLVNEELEKRIAPGKKTVLYVGIRYDYGNKRTGLSFEHHNFYHTLANMDLNLIYFDYDRIKQTYGPDKMNEALREALFYYQPDYLFYFHYHDWVDHSVWQDASRELPTKTIVWLADDHWRYEESRPVWELFDVVATTDEEGYNKRMAAGSSNVMLTQWACNHFLYRDLGLDRPYDVSFIGRNYGQRQRFVDELAAEGIKVATFGEGWGGSGRITQTDLVRIYNKSKMALNISFASKGDKYQIKGRDFEAPGCGALLLTQNVEGLERYYVPGEEIATYEDPSDAARQIKQYLGNDTKLREVARRGCERVLREHTYKKRFEDVFAFADSVKVR